MPTQTGHLQDKVLEVYYTLSLPESEPEAEPPKKRQVFSALNGRPLELDPCAPNYHAWEVTPVLNIGEANFVTGISFDEQKTVESMEQYAMEYKYVVVDLEGPTHKALKDARTSLSFQTAETTHFQILGALQPLWKAGFYALPPNYHWWKQNDEFYDFNDKIIDIIQAADFCAPSAYDFYKNYPKDEDSFKGIIREALRISGDKPVYPLVWNRYHLGSMGANNPGFQTISDNEFLEHLGWLLTAEYDGKMIDGLIAWSGNYFYLYQVKNQVGKNWQIYKPVFESEFAELGLEFKEENFNEYMRIKHTRTLELIRQAVDSS